MNASQSRTTLLLSLALLTPGVALAQGKQPTEAEKQQWQRASELTEAAQKTLGDFAADVQHERSYADVYSYEERKGQPVQEKFVALAAAEKENAPLKETIAALEAKYGTDPDQLQVKIFAEYGQPVVVGQSGFSRHMSPDGKKWLATDVEWPFKFYKQAKSYLDAPAAWRELVVTFAEKTIKRVMEYHPKNYDPATHPMVYRDRYHTKAYRDLLPPFQVVLDNLPDHPKAKALKEQLDAEIEKWTKIEEDLIDKQEWLPHVEITESDLDPDDLVDAVRERLVKWKDGGTEPIAIRLNSDWEIYSKNILGESMCNYIWVDAAYPPEGADAENDDLLHVYQLKVYTPEKYPAKRGPPFDDVHHDGTYLIRPGAVSQQGGGFFGTLVKLVLGMVCCFMFLGVVGGGGYFAYKQMNAQKAATDAAAKGGPEAPPPAAPTG